VSRTKSGQLGFHVSRDALITDVEAHSAASAAGLQPSCQLLRISGVDVVTMTHEQLIEKLRSESSAILTVVPHQPDSGRMRRL